MAHGEFVGASRDYNRIEKAIRFIETRFEERPGLQEIAGHVGMSEFHFQRLFRRWVGISPKRFLQFLTKEHVKVLLAKRPVLEAALAAGLSGPGRLHDLFVTCEAVTPGEFKAQGRGLVIRHGVHASPFGECLVGLTERGVCWLTFAPDGSPDDRVDEMRSAWANARFVEDRVATRAVVARIYDPARWRAADPLPVLVKGTNFQIKVWEALLRIPLGTVVAYEELALRSGFPRAVRAVGSAVGKNPVSFVIPCHRVVRKTAEFGNYGGGPARKKAMLAWESGLAESQAVGSH